MKATFREARVALKRPRNILVLSGCALISAIAIDLTDYVTWRRFLIPVLVFITGRIAYRIGRKRLKTSAVSRLICTASTGAMWIAGVMTFGAVIDSMLDVPQIVFWTMFTGISWVAFQMSRLETRLIAATPEDIAVITESSDVVRARLKDSMKKNEAALQHVAPLMEKLGLPALI